MFQRNLQLLAGLGIAVVMLAAAVALGRGGRDTLPSTQLEKQNLIRMQEPRPNATIKSPLTVTGEARGNWYFEATFPVQLVDANGQVLVGTYAQAKDDWMTENFVPFESEVRFSVATTTRGFLILKKSNASGLPEHDDELRVPVMIAPAV